MADKTPLSLQVTDLPSSQGTGSTNLPSPGRNPNFTPIPLRARTHTSMDLDDYFTGPRDMNHHSKWPMFLRLHGSILPKLILPLSFVGGWASAVTLISKFVYDLGISSTLLTVTGFVVGLALSFRSTTAYERYMEGRKFWALLTLTSRNLARLIWVSVQERHQEDPALGKADLLAKLTALNLLHAFAVALKHRLRFEPSSDYPDLEPLIANIRTLAGEADKSFLHKTPSSAWKATGEYLGVSFAESNPRKIIKRSRDNLGNLPLEILNYLSAYFEDVFSNATLRLPCHQSIAMTSMATLTDVLTGTERVLNTPVPIAYSISISQIAWVYILVLPFQLYGSLGWVTIFGTMLGAYIILGLAQIGYEIENPFGLDVNDLPLDDFCREIAADIDVLTSMPPPRTDNFVASNRNRVLFPLSDSTYEAWKDHSVEEIRQALRAKATSQAKSVEIERAVAQIESTAEKCDTIPVPEVKKEASAPAGGESC